MGCGLGLNTHYLIESRLDSSRYLSVIVRCERRADLGAPLASRCPSRRYVVELGRGGRRDAGRQEAR